MCLLQAIKAGTYDAGKPYAEEGLATLDYLIDQRGGTDSYPYVAYLEYACRWYLVSRKSITDVDWNKLRDLAKIAKDLYKLDERVKTACKRVEQAYLVRLVPDDEIDDAIKTFLSSGDLESPPSA